MKEKELVLFDLRKHNVLINYYENYLAKLCFDYSLNKFRNRMKYYRTRRKEEFMIKVENKL